MTSTDKFHTKNGLSAYALACGYIQREARTIGAYYELHVDLWHEGACYHVRAHEHGGRGRLRWESFYRLTDARKAYRRAVNTYLKDAKQ